VAYPRSRAAEKEASNAVVLKRQTPSVSVRWLRRQHPRRTQLRQTLDASDGLTTDTSVGRRRFWSSLNSVCWCNRCTGMKRRQTRCASIAFMMDASSGGKPTFGPYWTASVERRTCGPSSSRHVCWLEIDRWKFDSAGHVAFIQATDAVCRVCCKRDRRVW
jgi:hypothetical protein